MDAMQQKLKMAKSEIEEVLKKHDVAGLYFLHAPGWVEQGWSLWPSYSILSGDFPDLNLKSKASDYPSPEAQLRDQASTSQMLRGLTDSMEQLYPQFSWIADLVDQKLGAEHTEGDFYPDHTPPKPGGALN